MLTEDTEREHIAANFDWLAAVQWGFFRQYGRGLVAFDVATGVADYLPASRFDGTEPPGVRELVDTYNPAVDLLVLCMAGEQCGHAYRLPAPDASSTPIVAFERTPLGERVSGGVLMTILDTMRDPALFGAWFRDRASWQAWEAFLAVLFGLPMPTAEAFESYTKHTGRSAYMPGHATREAWVIVGRRGGKSRIAALVAVFLACFVNVALILAPGEIGTLAVIAADRRQARVVMRYIAGFLESVPMLQALVVKKTREAVELSNRITVEVHTANFRAVRGYTLIGVIADEIAFWRSDESANPDTEILNGLRPGMATVPGAVLLGISSPYARRGALWDAFKKHYGKDGDPVLVWQADTRSMNPSIEAQVIADAYAADEAVAAAEYGAEFRRDIEGYVSRETLDASVIPERRELPPAFDVQQYHAFVDPSGGSSDSMTLAIAHHADGRTVLDLVRERRPPFSPEAVTEEFAGVLKAYKLSRVTGDRYGGEWPRERFREHGVDYDLAQHNRSELYLELLPLLNSQRIELLDQPRLIAQLGNLERRTGRLGKDTIDHAPGSHDDVANAAAGAIVLAHAAGAYSTEGVMPVWAVDWRRQVSL